MKNIKLIAIAFVVLATTFSSCEKEADPIIVPPTKTELLCGKNWIMTAATVNPPIDFGAGPITDLFSMFSACDIDNFRNFSTTGSFTDNEGATKCDSLAPQTTTGTWSFNSGETVLNVYETDTANITLITLDASTLKGSMLMDVSLPNIVTVTFTKQ